MDFFYNAPDRVVDDVIDGLARIAPVERSVETHGVRLVLDRDRCGERVAVLSGGGAGHEPSHAGFVGRGMLAGAIAGELFTSPSVEAVLAAIRATCGAAGCLLVIKNYTGDRLNFGLAAERAAREGYKVRSVIVADDVALPDASQQRGLAGTVLVHKIAGHYAAQGADLDTVADKAQRVCDSLCSLGLALSSCTLPGHEIDRREPELGLGIHNEPGVRAVDPQNANAALQLVLEPLLEAFDARFDAATPMVVLLNNLGGCSSQEMGVLMNGLLYAVPASRVARVVTPAALMTSMDMHGFSVTLLPADEDFVTALESPVDAIGWPGLRTPGAIQTFEPMLSEHDDREPGARDSTRETLIRAVVDTLVDAKEDLDALDAKVGDGDTGTTFAAGARAVAQALDDGALSSGDDARLAHEIGDILARDMGGSSGVLLSILCTATGAALADGESWSAALRRGVARMQHYGGAKRGDRTLLDALIPAIDALADGADLTRAAEQARAGADETRAMTHANAGRSAYVREDALRDLTDPGAEAVARVWERLAEG
ncbi:dihydroxyacetone kinase subunit DhaK [Salinisphaera sp.]|uniref:dihydroxyacetone kinase subunit DhaK n=1 Tax=Salinisphaera sp. TaxID=1914330 RepID=UPI000C3B26EC|nr:dihydroxyacetone kinase subunit DhaK [Salinisphaera sp.]MAS09234.1 glycerol kinase [Salinisphaera sp.]